MSPLTGRGIVAESLKPILMCVESYNDLCVMGSVYHGSFDEGKEFKGLMQLLLIIEKILKDTGYPKETTEKRRFTDFENSEELVEKAEQELDFQSLKGMVATFKIKIMFRQYASWQGSVLWVEGNKTETFRSALELIMLMDDAMSN